MGGHKWSGVRADWSDNDYCTYYISRLSRNGLGWNRKNAKQQARDERFVAKAHTFSCWVGLFLGGGAISLLLHKLIPAPFPVRPDRQQLGLPISPQLPPVFGPELYEAETRPTYGSEAEPHPCNNGAA